MTGKNTTYDVFLSASPRDAGVAQVIRRAFEEAGLAVFSPEREISAGMKWAEAIREAIAESGAFVVILTPSYVKSEFLAFEYGGASIWNKPIYLLLEHLSPKELPSFLKPHKTFPISKLENVVQSIKANVQPLSERDRDLLAKTYHDFGVASDQLFLEPSLLDSLTQSFNTSSEAKLSPERVLRELFRLRKQGKLPRLLRVKTQLGKRTV